jgi:hypothetical protein
LTFAKADAGPAAVFVDEFDNGTGSLAGAPQRMLKCDVNQQKECHKIGAVMKTLVATAIIFAMLTGVASSQFSGGSGDNANTYTEKADAARQRAAEKQKEQRELDAKYKAALDKTKAPNVAPDPWAIVRPPPTTSSYIAISFATAKTA